MSSKMKRWGAPIVALLLIAGWLFWNRSPWEPTTVPFDPTLCDEGGCEAAGAVGGAHGLELVLQHQPGVDDATAQLARGLEEFWACVDARGIRSEGAVSACVGEATFPQVCKDEYAKGATASDGSAEALLEAFDVVFINEEGLCDPDD